jgi:hypothetical protein
MKIVLRYNLLAWQLVLHWHTNTKSRHGMAGVGVSRETTFKLTPQTTYWQAGKQVSLSNIQKGAKIDITTVHGVATRLDIL